MAFPWMGVGAAMSGAGTLLGAGSNLLGSRGMSQGDLMGLQFSTAKQMRAWELEHGPSLEMAGLRKAGINPMLRYGSGGSGVQMGNYTPTVAAPFNRMEGFADAIGSIGDSVSSAYKAFTGGERDTAETARTRIETALKLPAEIAQIQANTSLTQQQRENAISEQGRILVDTLLREAEIRLRDAQRSGVHAQIEVARENAELLRRQQYTEDHRGTVQMWTAYLTRAGVPEAENIGRLFDSAYGEVLTWLRETRRAAGL